jgi:vacuolar-type H+-ATPase subunit E/Vma4
LDNAYNKNSQQNSERANGESPERASEHASDPASVRALGDPPRFVAPTHAGVDILKLLTDLEEVLESARRLPGGLLMRFDDEKFHYLIMKIRANLPEEMKRASKLVRDTERIVEETKEHAERVMADAKRAALAEMEASKKDVERQRESLATEGRRLREEAHAEAERIQAEARAEAERLVSDDLLVQQAEIVSHEIQTRAEREAQAVRQGADEYAREVLGRLESVLNKAVDQVQHGRQLLEQQG